MSDAFHDQQAITDLVSALGRCLDDHDFEGLRELFTADATVTTPGGTATGHDALVEQARRNHTRFAGTQHVFSNVLVDLDGDRASARANLLASFALFGPPDPQPYQLGAVYRFGLARTEPSWLFTGFAITPVWSLNAPAA